MRRSLHISPPSGMAVIRQIPLKEKIIIISDCNRKYNKILHAPTEAKKSYYTSKHAKRNT